MLSPGLAPNLIAEVSEVRHETKQVWKSVKQMASNSQAHMKLTCTEYWSIELSGAQ